MIALLEELRKLIDAFNRSVVPPACSAANRNPWLAQNSHATNFLCSIELICLICWLKIVMIIHVSFCTKCRNCRMWVVSSDSGIPLFMRTGDGNESDKAVRSFYFK